MWLGQGSTAPEWKEDEGYNLNRWGDLMEVMEVNSSGSIGPHQQQQLQQQQAPDRIRPAPRGRVAAHAFARSNGQWQSDNAKRNGSYNSKQQQQQLAWSRLRPAPRSQVPAHASVRSNGQWQNDNAKHGGRYNSNQQQQQQAWGGLRPAHGHSAPTGQDPAGMNGWSVVSKRK